MPGGHDDDTMMILSPLTGAPVAVVSALSISDDLVHLTPLEASEHIEDYQPPATDTATPAPVADPAPVALRRTRWRTS